MSRALAYPTYESLGVRPLINCQGTYTIISGLADFARSAAGYGRGL